MNLLGAMCWLSRDTTEGAETRANRVQRARGGEELTGRKADFTGGIINSAGTSFATATCSETNE